MLIRPSLKFVKLSYVFCLLLAVSLGVYILAAPPPDPKASDPRLWLFILPAILAFLTLFQHMRKMLEKISILGDRLRFEGGLFSKSTRTIELEKVQDVRVDQTMWQRMFGIGNLSLETAGGTSRMEMDAIDNPQTVADHILSLARAQRTRPDVQPALEKPSEN